MAEEPADRRSVIRNEHAWHEEHAHRRYGIDQILYRPPAFTDVVDSALEFLQGRLGELVLDAGCGEGKEVVTLASRGLVVIGVDLSQAQLARARDRARDRVPDGQVYLVQANAERLPFSSASFRIIHGKAILHHLDLTLAAGEIRRLLTSGGRASFSEPLAHHPLFWLARRITPQLRTTDERPMTLGELLGFCRVFQSHEHETFLLLTPWAYLARVFPRGEGVFRRLYAALSRTDRSLFRSVPKLCRFAWYGAVRVRK